MSECGSYRWRPRGFQAVAGGIVVTLGLLTGAVSSAAAASPLIPVITHSNALEATTSDAARRDAIRSIPFDKLSADDRAKVEAVLSNVSLFRRLPTRVVDCDPAVLPVSRAPSRRGGQYMGAVQDQPAEASAGR